LRNNLFFRRIAAAGQYVPATAGSLEPQPLVQFVAISRAGSTLPARRQPDLADPAHRLPVSTACGRWWIGLAIAPALGLQLLSRSARSGLRRCRRGRRIGADTPRQAARAVQAHTWPARSRLRPGPQEPADSGSTLPDNGAYQCAVMPGLTLR